MPRIAFIGLGRMGHGMAGRYLDAGFTVTLWNRSKAKAEDLIARGAQWATSPEDAAIDADAVVTMVADDEASRAVWLGPEGAAKTAKAGTIAIECSTVSYRHALELARELRGRGLVYIDSPVTGLPDAAANGKLTLLVGAEPADLEKARPFLAPLSATIRFWIWLRQRNCASMIAICAQLRSSSGDFREEATASLAARRVADCVSIHFSRCSLGNASRAEIRARNGSCSASSAA